MDEKRNPRADYFISLVLVVDYSAGEFAQTMSQIHDQISNNVENYEVLIIDNGIDANQLSSITSFLKLLPAIRVIRLARPLGRDDAIFAGLDNAIGDFVITYDLATDPPEALAQMVDFLVNGEVDLVQGFSTPERYSKPARTIGRKFFYWYNKSILGIDIDSNATYLTGLSRRALNNLLGFKRSHKYFRHLVSQVGYPIHQLEYTTIAPRETRHNLVTGIRGAIEMISSYSTQPLRTVSLLGLLAAFINLVYAIYVLSVTIFNKDVAAGWTTTSLQLSAMFFVICLILTVQSEYLGRILAESRGDQQYMIKEELESESLIPNNERRNISG